MKTDLLVEVQIISMIQFHFPRIDNFVLSSSNSHVERQSMFKTF